MTKIFTTAILAMRALGSHGLNVYGPVKPYLPPGYRLTSSEGNVTFQQLATFTGGFDWSDLGDEQESIRASEILLASLAVSSSKTRPIG